MSDEPTVEEAIRSLLAETVDPLTNAIYEIGAKFAKNELEMACKNISFYLNTDLQLKLITPDDGEYVGPDFERTVVSLYDLIVTGPWPNDDPPFKWDTNRTIEALEALIDQLKQTKSTDYSSDAWWSEPRPMSWAERVEGLSRFDWIKDGRIKKPRQRPHYSIFVNGKEWIYRSRGHANFAFHAMASEDKYRARDLQLKCIYATDMPHPKAIPEVLMARRPANGSEVTLYQAYYRPSPWIEE